jgi:hypothetical protein
MYWTCSNKKIQKENTSIQKAENNVDSTQEQSNFIPNEIIIQFNEIEKESLLLEAMVGYELSRKNQVSKTLKINKYQFKASKIALKDLIQLIESQKEIFGIMHVEPNKKINLNRDK